MTGYFHRISPWKVGSVFAIIQTRVMWGGCYWVTILHLLAIPLLSKYDNCIIRFPPGKSLLKPSKAVGRVHCASLVTEMVKNLPEMQEIQVQSLGWKDPLEEGTTTHCSILAWRSPCTEEPGGLQSMVSQRVRHGWATTKHVDTYFEWLCYYPSRQISVYTNALFNILSITLVLTSETNSSY